MQQKPTEYSPTAAEKRILEVELNPENLHKKIAEKCRLAKINRSTYYESFKKPEFKGLVKNLALELVAASVLPTIHAVARESKRGSALHNKMILEMAGLYAEKTKTELTGKDGGPIQTQTLADLVSSVVNQK